MGIEAGAGRPVTGARPHSLLAPLAWTLYIALPVAGWGWLNGLPLGVLEAGAIALVWWTWAAARALPGARTLLALCAVKVLLGAVLIDGGFAARYYANDSWTPPVERSVEFRRGDITRRDTRLAFGGPGQPDLPLYFFNDLRFNFYKPEEPQRSLLAYSAEWDGVLREDGEAPAERTFYLSTAEGSVGELTIDDRPVLRLDGTADGNATVALPPGWHSIRIRVAAPYGSARRVEAGEIVDGARRPFDSRRVWRAQAGGVRRAGDAVVHWGSRAADILLLSWLTVLAAVRARAAARERRVGRLLWLAAIGEAFLFAGPFARQLTMLSGGDDWLTYEHLGRAIIGDVLLRQPGPGAGQGAPFYFQPLYPYFLALTHLVFGESVFGAVLVQRLLVAAMTAWAASITRRLFGDTAYWIALIAGGIFLYVKAGRWSGILLAEPLFTPLLVGWVLLLIRAAAGQASTGRLLLTGALGGIATLTRTTLFLAWPVVLPVWAASVRSRRLRATALVAAAMIAVVGMLTVRTWVVTGSGAVAPTSGGVALYYGNTPAQPLVDPPAERAAIYDRFGLTAPTRLVAEYAFQRPADFFGNLGRKTLYSVGLFRASGIEATGMGVPAFSLFYIGIWGAALVGGARLVRARPPGVGAEAWLPALVALTHFAAMVAFLPNVYGDRQILPMYPLLIPYAAFALEPAVRWARRHDAAAAAIALAALALLVFLPASPRLSDTIVLLIITTAILAFTLTRRPFVREERWLVAAGAAAALVVMIAHSLRTGGDVQVARYLLLPIAAVAVARLAGHDSVQRVALAALFAGPFITRAALDRFAMVHVRDPFLWIVAGVLVVPAALLTRGRILTRRAAAFAAIGCLAFAMVMPFLPGVDADLAGELADIRRGLPALTGSDDDARDELVADLRDTSRRAFEPFTSAAAVLTGRGAPFGIVCLLAVWILALLVSVEPRAPGSRAGRTAGAVVLGVFVVALAGPRVEVWGGDGYPLAALAMLAGIAHARFVRAGTGAATVSVP